LLVSLSRWPLVNCCLLLDARRRRASVLAINRRDLHRSLGDYGGWTGISRRSSSNCRRVSIYTFDEPAPLPYIYREVGHSERLF
jgi:hypothetical protein